jgi:hypothetical protein
MSTVTQQDYLSHLQQCRLHPQITGVSEVESIHRDETDAFAIAQMKDGTRCIIGRQDHPIYSVYPVGQCPVVEGAGYYDSVNIGTGVIPHPRRERAY